MKFVSGQSSSGILSLLEIISVSMHFLRSKSTLDSLKSVFNVCRRKPSLGAPNMRSSTVDIGEA